MIPNKLASETFFIQGQTMTLKETEDKVEAHDQDIASQKDMVFSKVTLSRDKDGTLVDGGSQRKEKYTEAEEGESSQVIRGNTGVSIRLEAV